MVAGHVPADADLTLDDEVQPVGVFALANQLGDTCHAVSLSVVGESLGEATGPVLC